MDKIVRIIFDVIFVVLIAILASYFILRFTETADIYRVQTGSMEDGIHTGDYILIYKKGKYNVGDVVTFRKDGYHVTHRIIKKNGNKVITKGDANNVEDEQINTSRIVGKVIYNGGFLNFLVDYKYAIASALLGLYLLSCYFVKRKEDEDDEIKLESSDEEKEIDIEEIEVKDSKKEAVKTEKPKVKKEVQKGVNTKKNTQTKKKK